MSRYSYMKILNTTFYRKTLICDYLLYVILLINIFLCYNILVLNRSFYQIMHSTIICGMYNIIICPRSRPILLNDAY